MRDLLTAAANFPDLIASAQVCLIETSPALRAIQQDALSSFGNINWFDAPQDISNAPSLIIANELLDALPTRQYVKSGDQWLERCVGLNDDETLTWVLGTGVIANQLLPAGHENEPDGAVFETAAAREAYVHSIAEQLKQVGGTALFVDYGHTRHGFGDTFQAIREHQYADPLFLPGECDLTSHVDFAALQRVALETGLHSPAIITQGEFLLTLGLLERAGQLGHGKDEQTQTKITAQAERLALPQHMGELFKCMAISTQSKLWPFDDDA